MTYNVTELDIMMYLKVELPFSYKLDPYPTEPQGEDLRFYKLYTQKRFSLKSVKEAVIGNIFEGTISNLITPCHALNIYLLY